MKSLLWNHFRKNDTKDAVALCNYCGTGIGTLGGNTSGLKKHLSARHPSMYAEFSKNQQESVKRKLNASATESCSKQPKVDSYITAVQKYANDSNVQRDFDTAIVDFLCDSFTPFYATGRQSFRKLFDIANPRITVKHPTTYSRLANDMSKQILSDIYSIVSTLKHDLESVAYTSDLWTSRIGDSYLSLTLQFIDTD